MSNKKKSKGILVPKWFIIFLISAFIVVATIGTYHALVNIHNVNEIALILEGNVTQEDKLNYSKTINGILVKSDIDDFTRIEEMMNNFGVVSTFYDLDEIRYLQEDPMGCYGTYYGYSNYLSLLRCDNGTLVRGKWISEEFILMHELGHYLQISHRYEQEAIADSFAIKMGAEYRNIWLE